MLMVLAAAYAADGQFDRAIHYQRDALKLAPSGAEGQFRDQLDAFEKEQAAAGDFAP